MLRAFFAAVLVFSGISGQSQAKDCAVLAEARGQTVHFNAWGGDDRINAYIAWVGEEVADRYGVTVKHIKVTDTAAVVTRVLAEKTAGRMAGGTVDLVWINGENFAAMKRNGLLAAPGPMACRTRSMWMSPANRRCGWIHGAHRWAGIALGHGAARLLPRHGELAQAAGLARGTWGLGQSQSGPAPSAAPDFVGTTFLKQALATFSADPSVLAKPVEAANFGAVTAPLWAWLEDVHPHLWRQGRAFPANYPAMRQLLGDLRSTSPSRSTPPKRLRRSRMESCPIRSGPSCWRGRSGTPISWPFSSTPQLRQGPKSSPIS